MSPGSSKLPGPSSSTTAPGESCARLDAKDSTRPFLRYLRERIAGSRKIPSRFGKTLRMNLAGLWCYRIGDYRLICRLEENRLVVLVLKVGHRREVYED